MANVVEFSSLNAGKPQSYKWIVVYDAETQKFTVTGYVKVRDKWSQDGAKQEYSKLIDAMGKIYENEYSTSRTATK